MNGQDLLQGLKICKSETQLGSAQSVLKKKENLRVLLVKNTFLGRISPVFLAIGLVQDGDLLDDLWSGEWMSGGLDT